MSTPEAAEPDPDTDRVRFEIRDGTPTVDDIAALTTAVLGLVNATASAATARPVWGLAGRLEATGQAPLSSATDPRLRTRASGSLPPSVT